MAISTDIQVAQRDKARTLLERALGPSKVRVDPEACEPFARDESEAVGKTPDAVVLAEGADDILKTLAIARETGVPVTPRAGGTGRTGGATPVAGGIVLCVMGMNAIKDIDVREQTAVVEPGVILSNLHAEVERLGLFYPPDPNSLDTCALGGNVAENAGGPRAFKYGVTRDYVLGLEAFLMGGQRLFCGRRTVKGVTGYDVAGLLVGSEGTLAVIGDVTLRLRQLPEEVRTLLALFRDSASAMTAVGEIIARGVRPRCVEFLDDGTLAAMRAAGNPLPENAGALLLIEVDGEPAACEKESARISDVCDETRALELLIARDGAQRERLWAARREMSPAVRKMASYKLSEDVVVPRQALGALLEDLRRQSDLLGIRTVVYGHAGDGNMHANFLWNSEDEIPKVQQGIVRLFQKVIELGGTLSGEHGIGVLKAPFLPLEQSPDLIALQRDLKRVFDPEGLLNPGKIFPPSGHRAC